MRPHALFILANLLASFALAQPTSLGPYFRLDRTPEANLLNGGATFKGSTIFGADTGIPYVYDGTWWASELTGTQSPRTLYVDPSGNDGNACTAPGASACATIQGALLKLPIQLNHTITINVATGNYTGDITFPAFRLNGGTINIVGTRVAPSLASGTTSGTLTATSTDMNVSTGAATFTDSSQSWTTNDLKEKFFEITSGPLSGVICPIISNTATTLKTSCGYGTTAAAGTSYVIRTPGPVVSGTMRVSGIVGRTPTTTLNGVAVTDVKLTASPALIVGASTVGFSCTRCVVENTSSTTSITSPASFTKSVVTGSNATTLAVGSTTILVRFEMSGSFIRNYGANIALYFIGAVTLGNEFYGVVQGNASTGSAQFAIANLGGMLSPNFKLFPVIIQCPGAELGAGLATYSTAFPSGPVHISFNGPRVESCQGGIILHQAVMTPFIGLVFSNTSSGLTLDRRAFVDLSSASMSFSGATTEISIDGTSYTSAFFYSLSPRAILGSHQSFLYSP
jgi:hypothetical protein